MKKLTTEEIEKIALEIIEEWKNDYNDNSNSNFIKNIINLIDQSTKSLIDEIAELKLKLNISENGSIDCSHDKTVFKHIRCNVCEDCGHLVEIDV